jgi:hypothetical protein
MQRKIPRICNQPGLSREIRLMFLLAAAVIFGNAVASPQTLKRAFWASGPGLVNMPPIRPSGCPEPGLGKSNQ